MLTVRPDERGGELLRWEVGINGRDAPELDVRVAPNPARPGVEVLTLVSGEDELTLDWCDADKRPAAFIDTLDGLRRSHGTK